MISAPDSRLPKALSVTTLALVFALLLTLLVHALGFEPRGHREPSNLEPGLLGPRHAANTIAENIAHAALAPRGVDAAILLVTSRGSRLTMDLQLKGKTALVSGSTLGIGFAIASTLAREGATVIVNGRTKERVDDAAARMLKENPHAQLRAAAGDLSTANGIDAVAKQFTDVDILVNNLGGYEAKPFFDISDADWQSMWEKNVMSGVRLSRQYMRGMLARNWGRVIFISSEAALTLSGAMLHYGVTKTAVLALSRGLADLTVGTAVTVNAVLPGPTRTEDTVAWMASVAKEKNISVAEAEKQYFETRPESIIRRFAEPAEIASLVAYVASPLSAVTNGASLRAEGGIVHSIG